MKKYVELALDASVMRLGEQTVVTVSVSRACLNELCVCLQLVRDKYVESCLFKNVENGSLIEINWSCSTHRHALKKNHVGCSFTEETLDYLLSYFLRYYRDGYAEVAHVDIEDEENLGDYITFHVEEFATPLSPKGKRKQLGTE